jgi:LAO/AO transport system kinase
MNKEQKLDWVKKRKERREAQRPEILFDGIRKGDIVALSLGITLLESSLDSDQAKAKELIQLCLPFSGNSIRVGITGVPGVGKSTFIETFGQHVIGLGKKIAVLAIDPTSQEGGGSILGDKTRMYELCQAENAFIRPTPSGNSLGGVARKTRESVLLCEVAGFDVIVIETVGVGQSETLVHSMVDFFLLLMLAGAGDELQGIKRGIMELADLLVINKADGENIKKADVAAREYKNALHLFPTNPNEWIPKTMTCSALENKNIAEVWNDILSFINHTTINGWQQKTRQQQEIHWFRETLKDTILHHFLDKKDAKNELKRFESLILSQAVSPFDAAEVLFKKWLTENKK